MSRQPWQITRDMFLSETEVGALLQHVRCFHESGSGRDRMTAIVDGLIIELLLFSGIKNTEFCRLRVEDFQCADGVAVLNVHETLQNTRQVYLPTWLVQRLSWYVTEVRPQLVSKSTTASLTSQDALFVNERGNAYERTALYRRVLRILTAAGLGERASVQLLRHTYGYLAYKQTGGNLLFVQKQLGHAHPMVTAIYAQFVEEDPCAIADVVGLAFRPTVTSKEN
ncbi:tyrosine-type recombinase/integrase [bacterium]|nr:tyrosine-type recombinase/integrase [bacterium]